MALFFSGDWLWFEWEINGGKKVARHKLSGSWPVFFPSSSSTFCLRWMHPSGESGINENRYRYTLHTSTELQKRPSFRRNYYRIIWNKFRFECCPRAHCDATKNKYIYMCQVPLYTLERHTMDSYYSLHLIVSKNWSSSLLALLCVAPEISPKTQISILHRTHTWDMNVWTSLIREVHRERVHAIDQNDNDAASGIYITMRPLPMLPRDKDDIVDGANLEHINNACICMQITSLQRNAGVRI